MKKHKITGSYYMLQLRTRDQAREYLLDVQNGPGDSPVFTLSLLISGQFGSTGIDWTGTCAAAGEEIALHCSERNDWRYTFLEEERQDEIFSMEETWHGTINEEDRTTTLNIQAGGNDLLLCSVLPDVFPHTNRVTASIMDHYNLGKKNTPAGQASSWAIKDLTIRQCSNAGNGGGLEMVCNFTLDFFDSEKKLTAFNGHQPGPRSVTLLFDSDMKMFLYDELEL